MACYFSLIFTISGGIVEKALLSCWNFLEISRTDQRAESFVILCILIFDLVSAREIALKLPTSRGFNWVIVTTRQDCKFKELLISRKLSKRELNSVYFWRLCYTEVFTAQDFFINFIFWNLPYFWFFYWYFQKYTIMAKFPTGLSFLWFTS